MASTHQVSQEKKRAKKMAKRALPSRTGVPHIKPHLCIGHAPYTSDILPMALTYRYSLVIIFNSRVGP
jgi:hypothetical protein